MMSSNPQISHSGRRWAAGFFWSLLSAFLWATVYVATRFLMRGKESAADPVTLSFLRFAIGGLLLFIYCFFCRKRDLFGIGKKDLLKIALLSLFSLTGMSVFLFWGQKYTTAVNASMLMSSSPVLTMLLGLFIGEKLTWKQVLGMAISTWGCMMVIEVLSTRGFGYSPDHIAGDLLVLLSSLSWAAGAVLAKRIVTPGNDLAVTAWSMLFAAGTLLLILFTPMTTIRVPSDTSAWILILYLAVFPTAIGFYAWNAALSRISLNLVNTMQYLTPIMTIALAWFFLQEPMNALQLAGATLVLIGVAVSSKRISRKNQLTK